jgi:DNA-binding transcriptional regulator YiaG
MALRGRAERIENRTGKQRTNKMAFTAEQIDEFVKLCAQQNPDPLEKMQIDFVKDGTTVSKQDLATLLLAHMESKGEV